MKQFNHIVCFAILIIILCLLPFSLNARDNIHDQFTAILNQYQKKQINLNNLLNQINNLIFNNNTYDLKKNFPEIIFLLYSSSINPDGTTNIYASYKNILSSMKATGLLIPDCLYKCIDGWQLDYLICDYYNYNINRITNDYNKKYGKRLAPIVLAEDLDDDSSPEIVLDLQSLSGEMGNFQILYRQNGKINCAQSTQIAPLPSNVEYSFNKKTKEIILFSKGTMRIYNGFRVIDKEYVYDFFKTSDFEMRFKFKDGKIILSFPFKAINTKIEKIKRKYKK